MLGASFGKTCHTLFFETLLLVERLDESKGEDRIMGN
jgi:hypothetical protein